ncbi:acyltransferase family protein [Aurantiacibacter hainanensis]|uniref:acyltransferase family protein n=1 Tax=Aurantiacibacter hainanensis TaxID=3076114 RepID=UPI0030C6DA32
MQATTATNGRQYGLDWLRIGAFALLIFYHVGMFFVPWGWHVNAAEPVQWAVWPMMAVNPWRLLLLFVISGIVSRALMAKLAAPGAFARSRSVRLAVPLLAGMVLFVAPQPWFELRDQGAYQAGFLHFWSNDYFEFGGSRGTPLPTWNHLWFVAYLWAYSLAFAALAILPSDLRSRLQEAFDQLLSGWRLAILPVMWLAIARLILHPAFGETHALLDDPYAHAIYAFAFFFGVGLARSRMIWSTILSTWRRFLGVAVLACTALFTVHGAGAGMTGEEPLRAIARAVLAWSMILGLLGFAHTHFHRDGPVRRYLTEAIFPYYIAHQTIILAAGFWLKQAGASAGLSFAVILLATLVGCALTYEVARRIGWLRPLLGLKPLVTRPSLLRRFAEIPPHRP